MSFSFYLAYYLYALSWDRVEHLYPTAKALLSKHHIAGKYNVSVWITGYLAFGTLHFFISMVIMDHHCVIFHVVTALIEVALESHKSWCTIWMRILTDLLVRHRLLCSFRRTTPVGSSFQTSSKNKHISSLFHCCLALHWLSGVVRLHFYTPEDSQLRHCQV